MRGIEDSDVIRPTAHLDHAHFMVNSLLTRSPMTSITIHRECRLDPNLIVTCSHISIDRAHRNTTKKRYSIIAMLGGSNTIPFYRPVVLWCCAKRDSIPLRFMHQPRSSTPALWILVAFASLAKAPPPSTTQSHTLVPAPSLFSRIHHLSRLTNLHHLRA